MDALFDLACQKFDVSNLKDFQKECVVQLTRKRDVFLSVKTGSGKSLSYQAFFVIWRAMNENSKCQVLVITPLIGRCGRGGTQAMALLIFNKAQCRGLDSEMKDYVNNDTSCRRQIILKTYNARSAELQKHLCCDICDSSCDCKSDQCKAFNFPVVYSEKNPEEVHSDTECDDRISSSSLSDESESDPE